MAVMAAIAAGLQVAGTIAQIQGERSAASQARQEAAFRSAEDMQNANQAQAAAEVKEQAQIKQNAYVLSNAQAASAGQGGTTTDPGVNTVMKTIAGEGRLRALTDMYEGNSKAQAYKTDAEAAGYQSRVATAREGQQEFSTILGGASSLFDKYATMSTPGGSAGSTPSAGTTSPYAWAPWQQPGYVNP